MADNKEIFVLTQMSEFDKSDKIDQQTDIIALQEGRNVRIDSEVIAQQVINKVNPKFIERKEKGQPNGVATLDENGKVPNSQLPPLDFTVNEIPIDKQTPTPTQNGVFIPTQIGVYPNFGGLEYTQEEFDNSDYVRFIFIDGRFEKQVKSFGVEGEINSSDTRAVGGDKIYDYTLKEVKTIADLRNLIGEEEQTVRLLGYYEAGDKPPLLYKWISGVGEDDGGSVINSTGGRWEALFGEWVDVRDFGANTNTDVSYIIEKIVEKGFVNIKGSKEEYSIQKTVKITDKEVVRIKDLKINIKDYVSGGIFRFINVNFVYIDSIKINGGHKTNLSVYINGSKEVKITKSLMFDFKETEGKTGNISRIIFIENTKKADIKDCVLVGMKPVEKGDLGGNQGTGRGISYSRVEEGTIENCYIRDIEGFEDGDCIHIQKLDKNIIPEKVNITIRNNNIINIFKRGVKLQCSGAYVVNNLFKSITKDPTTNKNTRSAVSMYGDDNVVEDNQVYFMLANSVFDINNGNINKGNIVRGNICVFNEDGERFIGVYTPCHFSINSTQGIFIENNVLRGVGGIHFTGTSEQKNIVIKNNHFYNSGFIGTNNANKVTAEITNNKFTSEGEITKTKPYELIKVQSLNAYVKDNEFNNSYIVLSLIGDTNIKSVNNIFNIQKNGIKYRLNDVSKDRLMFEEISFTEILKPNFSPDYSQNQAFGEASLVKKGNEVFFKMFANKSTEVEVGDTIFTLQPELRPKNPEFIVGHGGNGAMVVWLMIEPTTGAVKVQEFPTEGGATTMNAIVLSGSFFIRD